MQDLLDKQKEVEARMVGNDKGILNVAIEARNQVLWKAYQESFAFSSSTVAPEVKNLLLIGLTGAGKSSACFFLMNQSGCNFSNSLDSHTRQVIEVEGRAFGDTRSNKPNLRVFDVPGFGDTHGSDSDADQWYSTLKKLGTSTGKGKGNGSGIHQIMWIVNGAIRRSLEVRRHMLHRYRKTFGPAFYDHLSIIVNFVPVSLAGKCERSPVR